MKRLIAMFAAVAIAAMPAMADGVSASLKLNRPTTSVSKTGGGKVDAHGSVETKSVVNAYTGRITCNPPHGTTASVTVEAYFITRPIDVKGAKDTIAERRVIGKYDFGGENPATVAFEFSSPAATETTVSKRIGSRRRQRIEKTTSGTRHKGVILRALDGGKVIKAITEPNNPAWLKAAKAEKLEL